MNLLQKIKELFGFNKAKRLTKAKDTNEEIIPKQVKKESIIEELQKGNVNENEKSKSDKVKEILKTVGCKKEIFLRIQDFENINIQNLREILKILTSLQFSKYDLNVILSQNIDILNCSKDDIKQNIDILNEYIENKEIVKNIIYTNPFVLTDDISKKLENIKQRFNEIGLTSKEIENIMDENSNILTLDTDRLNNSLEVILDYNKTNEKVKEAIIDNPIIIGIIDSKLLEEV